MSVAPNGILATARTNLQTTMSTVRTNIQSTRTQLMGSRSGQSNFLSQLRTGVGGGSFFPNTGTTGPTAMTRVQNARAGIKSMGVLAYLRSKMTGSSGSSTTTTTTTTVTNPTTPAGSSGFPSGFAIR